MRTEKLRDLPKGSICKARYTLGRYLYMKKKTNKSLRFNVIEADGYIKQRPEFSLGFFLAGGEEFDLNKEYLFSFNEIELVSSTKERQKALEIFERGLVDPPEDLDNGGLNDFQRELLRMCEEAFMVIPRDDGLRAVRSRSYGTSQEILYQNEPRDIEENMTVDIPDTGENIPSNVVRVSLPGVHAEPVYAEPEGF